MIERSLKEILSSGIFTKKRVCIEETLPQNVTFLLVDISNALGSRIFAFNETAEHYKKVAAYHNKKVLAASIYDSEYAASDIVDDVWTASNVCETIVDGQFSVYRANSCKKSDWYNYDIVIKVEPLESGTSADIDGKIVAFDRQKKYFELKYKVLKDKTIYYS